MEEHAHVISAARKEKAVRKRNAAKLGDFTSFTKRAQLEIQFGVDGLNRTNRQ